MSKFFKINFALGVIMGLSVFALPAKAAEPANLLPVVMVSHLAKQQALTELEVQFGREPASCQRVLSKLRTAILMNHRDAQFYISLLQQKKSVIRDDANCRAVRSTISKADDAVALATAAVKQAELAVFELNFDEALGS